MAIAKNWSENGSYSGVIFTASDQSCQFPQTIEQAIAM
jgi:hypothetical protein